MEIDCHDLYMYLVRHMQSVHITRNQPNFIILSDLKIILHVIYLARKWGPNQVHTVRYQDIFSGYMSRCSSCLYLKPMHFLSANLIKDEMSESFPHSATTWCVAKLHVLLSAPKTFIFWTLRDCDQTPDIVLHSMKAPSPARDEPVNSHGRVRWV